MLEHLCAGSSDCPAASSRSIQGAFPISKLLPVVSRMTALICHDLRLPLAAIHPVDGPSDFLVEVLPFYFADI
jgi:hypothetical protein